MFELLVNHAWATHLNNRKIHFEFSYQGLVCDERIIYIYIWMKKSIQRTSHVPFNKNVNVLPVRAS